MNDLIAKIKRIAREENAAKITKVVVRLGALSHISADHFREHFIDGAKGTVAEGAELETEMNEDVGDPRAQDIMLLSVDIKEKE